MYNYNPIEEVKDDDLECPEVGEWGFEKYRILGHYINIFTTAMSRKWPQLVYIDLFSSSGYAKVKDKNTIIKTSSIIALSLKNKFTNYIFCEQDENLISSLEQRVKRDFGESNTRFIHGDCNENINKIVKEIPRFSREKGMLGFCFVDPYALQIKFQTLREIGKFRIDFMILIPTGMALKRNENNYINLDNNSIADFLDDENWRLRYKGQINVTQPNFTRFIVDSLTNKFEEIGYCEEDNDLYNVVYKQHGKKVSLYHLKLFTRNKKGKDFWNEASRRGTQQGHLF